MQPATKRQIDFGEGDDVVGPIRGVLDNGKNPSLPYAAAVGTIPLDLKGELYQVQRTPHYSVFLSYLLLTRV